MVIWLPNNTALTHFANLLPLVGSGDVLRHDSDAFVDSSAA